MVLTVAKNLNLEGDRNMESKRGSAKMHVLRLHMQSTWVTVALRAMSKENDVRTVELDTRRVVVITSKDGLMTCIRLGPHKAGCEISPL